METDYFTRKSDTLVMAHNNGLPENIHFYELEGEIKEDDKCKPVRTGPAIAKSVGELNKRSLKYFKDHETTRLFPPTYYLEENATKQFVDKIDKFELFRSSSIKIMTNYNPNDHLTLLGLSNKDRIQIMNETSFENFENVVLIVHPEEKWLMVNVVVDVAADANTLHREMNKMDAILKTIYKTGYQQIKNHYMTLIGVMVCPQLNEQDLETGMFPFLNSPMSTFVTEGEWNGNNLLEQKLALLIDKSKNYIKSHCQSGAISRSVVEDLQVFTGQLMASMAQRSLFLPKVTNDLEEKIDTILLNEDQIEAINNPCKWKIINGGFGSGKTVVLNEIARKMIKKNDIGTVCYLPFAPYSLIDQKFSESFMLLCKNEKIEHLNFKLKSNNCLQDCLAEMGLEFSDIYDLTSPPKENVSVIIEHLKSKYCSEGKNIAILIDEFPREFVDQDYANSLADYLKEHCPNITVVISFQSVEKIKEIESNGKVTDSRECSINIPEMMEFKLGKTMRMSLDNFHLNEILKSEIALTKHVTPLAFDNRNTFIQFFRRSEILYSSSTSFTSQLKIQKEYSKTSENDGGPFKYIESLPSNSNLTRSKSSISKLETSRLHDAELLTRRRNSTSKTNGRISHSMKTKTFFVETHCGHSFSCEKNPKLHLFSSPLTTLDKIICLSSVLERCIKDHQKVVITCISKHQVETMKIALDQIKPKKKYFVYTPYLLGPLPSSKQKSEIIEASNGSEFVLITDYRSYRGCEAEKCIMLIELNTTIGANLYVEILTRSVAYLDILVTPRAKGTPSGASKVMEKVLKEWKKQKLVTEVDVKMYTKKTGNIKRLDIKIIESGKTIKNISKELQHGDEETFNKSQILSREVDDHSDAIL